MSRRGARAGMLAINRRLRPRPRLLAWIGTAVLVACGVGASNDPRLSSVDPAARAAIIARVGDEFFWRYITVQGALWHPPEARCSEHPDACADAARRGFSSVTYRLQVPETPWVDAIITCIVDAEGRVSRVDGAPDCVKDPGECSFPYDEFAAEAIAAKAGLELGIALWGSHFHWDPNFRSYVWVVSNTLDRHGSDEEGRSVAIDANDGRVLGRFCWSKTS